MRSPVNATHDVPKTHPYLCGKSRLSFHSIPDTNLPDEQNVPVVPPSVPENNHISNLEWCNRKYNVNYGTGIKRRSELQKGENHYMYGKHHTEEAKKKMSKSHIGIQKGSKNPKAKKVKCIETGKIFYCIRDAEEFLGTKGHGNISSCCKGKRKKAYGYHWEYVE